jgi:plastocyanin
VVSRQRLTLLVIAVAVALAGASASLPSPARASDAKVAIGDYRWSHPVVHVDLGQRVTWYWVGPDTMHSVTGVSANDAGEDSDPHRAEPEHRVGHTFRLSFSRPGVYEFRCKLHPVVHGEVIVSATPGNPADDPDPIPRPNVNLMKPTLTDFFLASRRSSPQGTELHLALDDPSVIDAEIWHADRRGRRTTYAGWQQWRGHIGLNELPFATRGRHFTPRPGRYVAYVKATDMYNNVSRTRTLRFTIRPATSRGSARARRSAPLT